MSIYRFCCLLFPRPDATSRELKKLAKAIWKWWKKQEEAGIEGFVDPRPIEDLRHGELPLPMALRMTQNVPEPDAESLRLPEDLGGLANIRAVPLLVDPGPGGLGRVVEGLLRWIPAELVEEIVIYDTNSAAEDE